MRFDLSFDRQSVAQRLPSFLELVGKDRWVKRTAQLNRERRSSPFREKIVLDYHWLEIVVSGEVERLAAEERLSGSSDAVTLAALHFATTVVEVHARLGPEGRHVLEGRLRDALNAETGFAALFLEIDLAQQVIASGGDVTFTDTEGGGAFDLLATLGNTSYEIECKSISVDAGRAIHRKDFYRFMEAITPALKSHLAFRRHDILTIMLSGRLPPNPAAQQTLRSIVERALRDEAIKSLGSDECFVERHACRDVLDPEILMGPDSDQALRKMFGTNAHIAGSLTEAGGCIVVMKSEREDDTSKPVLEAMRKGASQLSSRRPSFIAVQFQDVGPADLMSPSLRRRMGILSYALFGHYGAAHVNASYFSGYGAVVSRDGGVGTPAFTIPNPKPAYPIDTHVAPFMTHVSDAEFAALIGAPLPAPNISYISFE